VLGLCAVMRPEKNHRQLIDAVGRLRRRGADARALFVGDGPSRSAIEARAASMGIADQITFAGMAADTRPWVAAFDIGVCCSTSIETLSLATLEAMAMGVPAVMSALGGAAEIVDGVNGRIFPVGDLDGLCGAIDALRSPETLRIAGRAARASAVARFDRRAMTDRYLDWFQSLATAA
jgi:glycosyltransferase involved in cell wall biosynthesis